MTAQAIDTATDAKTITEHEAEQVERANDTALAFVRRFAAAE
jgi:hypothetical protein